MSVVVGVMVGCCAGASSDGGSWVERRVWTLLMMLVVGMMVVRVIVRGTGRLSVTMNVTSAARGSAKGI